MHHSRLHVILIDTPPDTAEATASFWCAALGTEPEPEVDSPFTVLATLVGGEVLAHQRLESGAPRLHLDIETDDVAAEVDRLVGLGADRVSATGGCVQLQDPAGLVFCVVPVQSDDFQEHASTWN
jgi:hypothetical protein